MKTSPRPKPKPKNLKNPMQMPKSLRPKTRSDYETEQDVKAAEKGYKAGGKVSKMATGGMCRGMGAATKGGKYSKSG
jgi:hypothetical protein